MSIFTWKEICRRGLAALLALVMVFGLQPWLSAARVYAQIEEESVLSLDDIAWEELTYRDIFITNNQAYVDGFNKRSFSPFVQNTGSNAVTSDAFYSGPYSLAAFGTSSQQIKSADALPAGDYFIASKVYCTRYNQGELGVCLFSTTVGATEVTDGFVTASGIVSSATGGRIFIGSIHSADLDGYVDDPVVVDMSLFETAPTEAQLTALYENYAELEKAVEREEVPYTEQECLDAFVEYMNEKAGIIGMENSSFVGPIGTENITTASDLLRLMVYAYTNYPQLNHVWSQSSYTVTVTGDNAREQSVVSTVIKPALEDYYHIFGGKTGTLSAYNARNLAVILQIPDSEDRLAVVALYANGLDTDSDDRFEAVRQIADAALAKYEDPTLDNSSTDVCCSGAIACLIPAEGADLDELQILYEKDAYTQRVPASITKVLAAVCALDHMPEDGGSVTYSDFDTQIGSYYKKDFLPGDTVSFADALYAMLLPSSNVTARAVGRTAGEWILSAEAEEPVWEVGTIAYATGLNRGDTNRLRTADYLKLSEYGYVAVDSGYMLVWFVYDENYAMLSATTWLGSGAGFSVDELQEKYSQGVYFRVALCSDDQRELTLDDLPSTGVEFYGPGEQPEASFWESGTIASANGLDNVSSTRLRTADYLKLTDYSGVGIGFGYTMTNFVYDAEYKYLGTSSWLGSGVSFTTEALQEQYPEGMYFRVALRSLDQRTLTVEDIPATGVKCYAPGETIPRPESSLQYADVGTVGAWQDGAVCDGKLFVFGSSGTGAVYALDTLEKLGTVSLDNKDILNPHANSVCFGSTYYAEGDRYPLLYVNIYNNYASAEDRLEGTCCVYRLTEADGVYSTDLVQVIEIGFTEDLTLWKSKENNGDVRPYGNFVVDTDRGKLYAFVMRDADRTTRFFEFDLPALSEGTYSETYGCNVVTLKSADIESRFDTVYFNYLQGCCYYDGKIISVEGFNSGGSAEPAVRIIDLSREKVSGTFYPAEAGLTKEPEVVCVEASDGTLYYAAADGMLRKLTLPEEEFTHAVPKSEGVANAIRRAYQLTDVQWTPAKNMPGVLKEDGSYHYEEFLAGVTYRGIPYSGVISTDTYVGLNVSLESFLTALENENSVLYTENLYTDSYPKTASYFGTVCSKFAQYVLDVPGSYNTNNVANIPGMDTIALPGEYTVDQIELGDVILDVVHHTTVCTDILYDADGDIAYIEISEAVSPVVRRKLWSAKEFYEHFADYRLCRWQYIDDVPAAPAAADPEAQYALMPRYGNKYNYKVSSTKGVVDILQDGYSKAVILRDGEIIDEITLNGAETFAFDRSVPGYLEMYLEAADGTRSGSVYACVVQSSVTVDDATKFVNGKLTVTIDGSCGTPLYVQVGSAHAIFCNVEGQEGTIELTFSFSKVSTQQVRVAYQNEYGIYLSSWVSFTAEENPSDDPLLSQGKYWNGYNITPSSPTPVMQENKVGYWSYTMVPVKAGVTYYSEGATRMWYLDADGDPISTYNAYKDSEVPFQFTVPEGTAYASIAYAPDLIEQGTETIRCVHSYNAVVTPSTCTEQGYTTYTCECGDSYVDDYVDATGHSYENGSCTDCGAADPDHHLPGDINGDGEVNNKDLTRLFKYLTGYDVEVQEAALDVNGDGSVNNKDQTRLFRYLSGWDVEIC